MQKIWGFGMAIALAGLIAGCQSTPRHTDRTVQTTKSTVNVVSRYSATDFMGRWVSPRPATSVYLNTHHQLVMFRGNQRTIREHFTIKLVNNRATLMINNHHAIKLDLDDANNMTMHQNNLTTKLTKDPNWSAQRSEIPTNRTVALKESSLTPAFKPSY